MASSKKSPAKAPKGAAPQAPTSTAQASTQKYKVATGKQYSPRATTLQGNAASWQSVTQFLGKQPGNTATLVALQAHLATDRNHANFAKYAIRRGWLVAAK